jgi:hypothetical protein
MVDLCRRGPSPAGMGLHRAASQLWRTHWQCARGEIRGGSGGYDWLMVIVEAHSCSHVTNHRLLESAWVPMSVRTVPCSC